MAIKRARYKHHNGTGFDTIHHETQAKQVKVYKSGSEFSNLEDLFINGFEKLNVNLNTITDTGYYKIGGESTTNAPTGLNLTSRYLMKVNKILDANSSQIVRQEIYNHVSQNRFIRIIKGSTYGAWKEDIEGISSIQDSISAVSKKTDSNLSKITSLEGSVSTLSTNLSNHNHDSKYLKLSGGSLTGALSVANNSSVAGKNTGGSTYNIGKVNTDNEIVLGDVNTATTIISKGGNFRVSDGSVSRTVFHTGNMGSGSGLDADKLDGLEASTFARKDVDNVFNGIQIFNGKDINLRFNGGAVGGLNWRDASNNFLAGVKGFGDGRLELYTKDTTAITLKPNGEMESRHKQSFIADSREAGSVYKQNTGDGGVALSMSTGGIFAMTDKAANRSVFSLDRSNGILNLAQGVKISGKRLSIGGSGHSSPAVGDIWIQV